MASEAVRQLYEEDQADRLQQPIDWDLVSKRDHERRAEVRRLLGASELKDGWDHYWAAVVLIHSRDADDLQDALTLSRRAFELEPEPLQIRAFHALAVDRFLLSQGRPQRYGTQKVVVAGEVALAAIEPDAVTDRERSAMGVLTLDERRREIDRINRARNEQRRRQASSPAPA